MKSSNARRLTLTFTALLTLLPSLQSQITPVVTTLYSFANGTDGGAPEAGLIQDNNGTFYGTTSGIVGGGGGYVGTVFGITSTGLLTILPYSFGDTTTDGGEPEAGLAQGSDGNFYGTTYGDGITGAGTIFRITPTGMLTTLYTFTDGTDGGEPEGGLVQGSDGNFYGTTSNGGGGGAGTIFRITPTGVFTTLYNFTSAGTDGGEPQAGLVQGKDGNFYGTASGASNNAYGGAVFRITPAGVFTTLYSFTRFGTNEGGPEAGLIQGSDGNFYGTTNGGYFGIQFGTVFRITPTGVLTTLYTFTGIGTDGAYPQAGLVQGTDGNFYGTTYEGGSSNRGTVFRVTPAGTLTTLHSFTGVGTDGGGPVAGLVQGSDGNFYGTTVAGGSGGYGTVFELNLTPLPGTLQFSAASYNTAEYVASVILTVQRTGGSLGAVSVNYTTTDGTALAGADYQTTSGTLTWTDGDAADKTVAIPINDHGIYNGGTVSFSISLTNPAANATLGTIPEATVDIIESKPSVTTLYNVADGIVVHHPTLSLSIQGSDGNFYGTTANGGINGTGTVFRITPSGVITTLYSFSPVDRNGNNADGKYPSPTLIEGSDGNFYGTTSNGGSSGEGTIFSITSEGVLTALYSFTKINAYGIYPSPALVQGSDGNFYGTTPGRGTDKGTVSTIFSITPTGVLTTLYTAADTGGLSNIAGFVGGLVQGRDGNFYGTTADTVFRITPMGVVSILHRFAASTDGESPVGTLVLGSDGNFYGATSNGTVDGIANESMIFQITPAGVLTTLHTFLPDKNDDPITANLLVQGSDGDIYGTTYNGGSSGAGTIFQITPTGVFTTLYNFTGAGMDGYDPLAGLVQGKDGNLYGTTSDGGSTGGGTVFRLSFALPPSVDLAVSGGETVVVGGAAGVILVSRTGGDDSQPLTVSYKAKGAAVAGVDYKKLSGSVTIPAGAVKAKIKVKPLAGLTGAGTLKLKVQLLAPTDGSYEIGTSLVKIKLVGE